MVAVARIIVSIVCIRKSWHSGDFLTLSRGANCVVSSAEQPIKDRLRITTCSLTELNMAASSMVSRGLSAVNLATLKRCYKYRDGWSRDSIHATGQYEPI